MLPKLTIEQTPSQAAWKGAKVITANSQQNKILIHLSPPKRVFPNRRLLEADKWHCEWGLLKLWNLPDTLDQIVCEARTINTSSKTPETLRAWVAMRSILYSTLPHPLLRSTHFDLPERVLDHLVVVEGVDLASVREEAASEAASEAPRTSVVYY